MRKTKKFLITISIIAAIFAVLNIIPPKQVENNPFIVEKGSLPMLVAHRGGKFNNPDMFFSYFFDNIEQNILIQKLYHYVSNMQSINGTDIEIKKLIQRIEILAVKN